MWTERQDDATVLSRIWPLASTTAERLWSSVAVNISAAASRFEEQRCRMAARGVPVGVASGPGTCPLAGPKHAELYERARSALLQQLDEVQLQSEEQPLLAIAQTTTTTVVDHGNLILMFLLTSLVVWRARVLAKRQMRSRKRRRKREK